MVARFDQGHAQQTGKKFPPFGLSDPGQDFEHFFEIIAVRQSVLASPRDDEVLIGHDRLLSILPILSQLTGRLLAIRPTMRLMIPIDIFNDCPCLPPHTGLTFSASAMMSA
jgi:hypothetical protein